MGIVAFLEVVLRLQNAQILSQNSWKTVPVPVPGSQELYEGDHSSATSSMVARVAISVAYF